jgi:hypothetical protein
MNLMHFLTTKTQHLTPPTFFSADQFPLDDEAIADLAINAMLLVMNNAGRYFGGHKGNITDYAALVAYGVRFPWKDRISFGATVDLTNDELPDYAAIGMTRHKKGQFAQCAYACEAPDFIGRKYSALAGATKVYRVGIVTGYDSLSRQMVTEKSNNIESVVDPYFAAVMPDGTCVGSNVDGAANWFGANVLAYVVGLHNDRRYFWDVQATEEFWDGFPAKAHFSIDKEYVKSLFYARSVPMTDKGRLRPILHWVKAHQRRIKEGIEIDIEKHLRGIDAFSMHGVKFQINAPRKAQGRKAL